MLFFWTKSQKGSKAPSEWKTSKKVDLASSYCTFFRSLADWIVKNEFQKISFSYLWQSWKFSTSLPFVHELRQWQDVCKFQPVLNLVWKKSEGEISLLLRAYYYRTQACQETVEHSEQNNSTLRVSLKSWSTQYWSDWWRSGYKPET